MKKSKGRKMIVDERISAYLSSLERDMPKELLLLEKDALANHVPIISRSTQALLKFLLKTHKAKNILEVGTAIGFSALFISEYSSEDCKITTIEKRQDRIKQARKNLSDKSFPKREKIKLLEGDALDIMEELYKKNKEYDFIFLDSAKAQYMNFLPFILKLLQEGGILLTDNVLQDGTVAESRFNVSRRDRTIHARMREYLYSIKNSRELETIIIPLGDGVAISSKQRIGERIDD